MELNTDKGHGHYIDSYTPTCITIDKQPYSSSLILTPKQIMTDWPINSCDDLTPENCQSLMDFKPQLIIIGTGSKHVFPAPQIMAMLNKTCGIEFMSTNSACLTYNLLMSEERDVVVGLIISR